MTQRVPVRAARHGNKSWRRFDSYSFAVNYDHVPLVKAEIGNAVPTIPLAFVRREDRYVLAALLSLVPGDNLYVDSNGRWLGGYIPAAFRGHPFSLAPSSAAGESELLVDETSGLIHEEAIIGEPFFGGDGALAPALREVLNFLVEVERNRAITDRSVAALAEAGLIIPWEVNGPEGPVAGLFRIDEAAFNALGGTVVAELHRKGALSIAYGQIFSRGTMGVLKKLARLREELLSPPDLEQLVIGDGDLIKFD